MLADGENGLPARDGVGPDYRVLGRQFRADVFERAAWGRRRGRSGCLRRRHAEAGLRIGCCQRVSKMVVRLHEEAVLFSILPQNMEVRVRSASAYSQGNAHED